MSNRRNTGGHGRARQIERAEDVVPAGCRWINTYTCGCMYPANCEQTPKLKGGRPFRPAKFCFSTPLGFHSPTDCGTHHSVFSHASRALTKGFVLPPTPSFLVTYPSLESNRRHLRCYQSLSRGPPYDNLPVPPFSMPTHAPDTSFRPHDTETPQSTVACPAPLTPASDISSDEDSRHADNQAPLDRDDGISPRPVSDNTAAGMALMQEETM